MTDRRLMDDGTSTLASPVDADSDEFPLSDAQWTTEPDDYPLRLRIAGELVAATGITTDGTQTFTGVERALNGVAKAHAAGTPVRVADGLRLTVGHAVSPPTPIGSDPPEAIDDLAATAGVEQVNLAWSVPTSTEPVTSYDVQRSTVGASGPWTTIATGLTPTTSYADTGLPGDIEHWYQVRARSSEGAGDWSNADSATPTAAATAFPQPAGVTPTNNTSTGTTTHNFALPGTLAEGDILVASVNIGHTSAAPSGGTLDGWSQRVNVSAHTFDRWLVYTVGPLSAGQASALAGGTITFSTSSGNRSSGGVARITGAGAVQVSAAPTQTHGAAPDPAALLPAWGSAKTLWLTIAAHENVDVSNPPAGWIPRGGTTVAGGGQFLTSFASLESEVTSVDPGPWALASANWSSAVTLAFEPSGTAPVDSPPQIPAFSGTPTVITAGQNVKTIIEAGAEGTHFLLAAGTHNNCENVRLKTGQHVRLATGCILEGTGKGYCFRPLNQSATNIAVGGDPAGARPIIRNYGLGSTDARFAAVLGIADDVLAAQFVRQDTTDWFVYHLELDSNSAGGVYIGSNWTVYDCESHGHAVTGIGGSRFVGGTIWGNFLHDNMLNPAGGAFVNGANMKLTWVNSDEGRTSQTPIDRAKAPVRITQNTSVGSAETTKGIWLDLDCQQVRIDNNTVSGHSTNGIQAEGCNDVEIDHNTVTDCDGHGDAGGAGANFINGAITVGESTNCSTHHNTIIDCTRAIVNRLSNRTDWAPGGAFPVADPNGSQYWITSGATFPGSPLPVPSASARSNIWTGNDSYVANTLINCGRVYINAANGYPATSGYPSGIGIVFTGNDYTASPAIAFYDRSTTALSLAQWQALGYN